MRLLPNLVATATHPPPATRDRRPRERRVHLGCHCWHVRISLLTVYWLVPKLQARRRGGDDDRGQKSVVYQQRKSHGQQTPTTTSIMIHSNDNVTTTPPQPPPAPTSGTRQARPGAHGRPAIVLRGSARHGAARAGGSCRYPLVAAASLGATAAVDAPSPSFARRAAAP